MSALIHGAKVKFWLGSGVSDADAFILDDPTQGLLDTGGVLSGDVGTEVQQWVYDVQISRGRSRELDRVQTGVCTLRLRNQDRELDPMNDEGYLLDENGVPILDENGALIIIPADRSEVYTPGKRVTVESYGQVIYDGVTDDWRVSYQPKRYTDATVACVDALGELARREIDANVAADGQMPGARIGAVLNLPEVVFGLSRDIDVGGTPLQGDVIDQGTNALSYLQTVAETDFGALFASRQNTLTFRDRYSGVTGSPVATFSTEGDGIPIHGIEFAVGSELFYNRVDVSRDGGDTKTADNTESQALYGIRKLSMSGLMMQSDEHAKSLAELLVSIYSEPTRRVAAIRVNLAGVAEASDRGLVASLDIGSVVDVTVQPMNVGTVISQTSIVEGVDHTISAGQPHVVTLRLSPLWQAGQDADLFILDDATLGLLDTGGVLAY